ncbi:MAG: carbohydrate porin [Verrucomicrobia bacterium]|nr:carbohydrate porin [Verrucomicrobiota bacterium]MBU6446172.1 carbohydrate porin [Verrucomicrobiota bacterium]MDE3047763.1 carbohydrate porin [Verrucomicrobiota bacterium]
MIQYVLLFIVCSVYAAGTSFRGAKEQHDEIEAYYRHEHRDWWQGSALFGSDATKERLAQNGITILSAYTTDMIGNPIGGKARGFAYAGSYGVSIDIKLTQAGLKGFEIFSSAVWRTGTSLSQRKIDNQFPVQQVFGSQTVKLNELYLMQTLLNGNLVFKLGRLDEGNDFLTSPLYWQFVNNGFDGNPISIFFNVPFVAYPNATWGAFLMFKPVRRLSAKFGAYNANSNIQKNKYHGVNFTFKSTNGVIWITEWCVLVNQEPEDHGMPGNYKAGYFYLTGDEPKFTGGKQHGDPCYYLLFDQMIYRREAMTLTPFISLVFAPPNRNLFPIFFNCGLVWKGPLPKRPNDSINLGYIYGKYSWDQAQVQSQSGIEPQNYETIFELNYWIQFNRWFYIAPDLQYVLHPKGRDTPNAFCIGAQIGINVY